MKNVDDIACAGERRADLLQFDDNFFFGPDNPEFVRGLGAVWTEPIANVDIPVMPWPTWPPPT